VLRERSRATGLHRGLLRHMLETHRTRQTDYAEKGFPGPSRWILAMNYQSLRTSARCIPGFRRFFSHQYFAAGHCTLARCSPGPHGGEDHGLPGFRNDSDSAGRIDAICYVLADSGPGNNNINRIIEITAARLEERG